MVVITRKWFCVLLLYSHDQLYAYTCRNNTIKTSGHSSLEKYTSHIIRKGYERFYCVRGELETEQNCNILTPELIWLQQHFFPVLLWYSTGGLGAWGPSLCWDMVLIPASSLQLIWTSCRRGYIIICRPPTSCERHNSHSIQPVDSQGYPPISSTGCTCYLHRCISHLTARPGRRSICNTLAEKLLDSTVLFYSLYLFASKWIRGITLLRLSILIIKNNWLVGWFTQHLLSLT